METVPCNLCRSTNNTLVLEARDYITQTIHKVVRCSDCNLVFVNPRPEIKEIGEYYPALYYGDEPFSYEKIDAENRFKTLSKYISPGCRVLDIGCGRGLVLEKCKQNGCETWGTELSQLSSQYAREKLKLRILDKHLTDCAFSEDYFDIVTMYHSLEHQFDPLSVLREVHRILKPEGKLVLEVPRFNCRTSSRFKANWFHLDVPRHLYQFEDETLEKLLLTSGYSIIQRKKYSIMYDAFGAMQSLLNVCCSRKNLLNDLNTKRITIKDVLKTGITRNVLDLILSIYAQYLLFPLFLLIFWCRALSNNGGTLIYVSKKLK